MVAVAESGGGVTAGPVRTGITDCNSRYYLIGSGGYYYYLTGEAYGPTNVAGDK